MNLLGSNDHTHHRFSIALAVAALMLAIIACQIDVGGPEPPGQPIPTHVDAASELSRSWQAALSSAAKTGQVIVLLDEMQLTSFLAHRLEENEHPALLDPQVYLRQNAIQVYGITESGPFKASVLVVIEPFVNPDGSIELELTTAEIGPIPAPVALKDTISAILTEAFTGSIGSLATGIRVSSLAIADGEMAIVGELR
jgi:hypothetical protein